MFNTQDQKRTTWSHRAEMCADMIARLRQRIAEPLEREALRIADVGCGDMKLKRALEERGLRCHYDGFDLIPQSPDVRLFDVRRDVLPTRYAVVTLLGVIEYIEPLDEALRRLADCTDFIVLSHVIRQDETYTPHKCKELGWINHLSQGELEDRLHRNRIDVLETRLDPEGKTLLLLCQVRR